MKALLLAAERKAKWKELEGTAVSSAKQLPEPFCGKVVEWKSKSMEASFLLRDDQQKPDMKTSTGILPEYTDWKWKLNVTSKREIQ